MSLDFEVNIVDAKAPVSKKADTRSLAARFFTKIDHETGEVKGMPLSVVDCSFATAAAQGRGAYELTGTIPVFLNYKGRDPEFDGDTKGKDLVVLGRRPGKMGTNGVMLAIDELDDFINNLTELKAHLQKAVSETREKLGIKTVAAAPKKDKIEGKGGSVDLDAGLPE